MVGFKVCTSCEPGTLCCAGLLGRAVTWSRGPACGDATVKARISTAHDDSAPCPAPRSHPSAKADGTCSALRGTWRPISGHLLHACLADRVIYRLRQSSRNWLGTWLAMPPGPRRVCAFGAGTGGGALLPQTAASGNVSQRDPESFMNYPG